MKDLITEEQAYSKICPHLRNPDGSLSYCHGSACMMWEWFTKEIYPTTVEHFKFPQLPKLEKTNKGYCSM